MSQENEVLLENLAKIREVLSEEIGFEVHPFKVQWYNELVEEKYRLPYDADTIGVAVISTPDMFEKAFKEYLATGLYQSGPPTQKALIYYMEKVQKILPETDVRCYFDKDEEKGIYLILTQTSTHVAGGAYYYQRRDVTNDPWDKDTKIYGFSIHPRYGGWISLDAAIFLKSLRYRDLPKREPVDCVPTDKERIRLLKMLNEDGDYWGVRDIIPVEKKYTEEHIKYLKSSEKEQENIAKKMIENLNSEDMVKKMIGNMKDEFNLF